MSADRRFTGISGDGREVRVLVWDDAAVAEVWIRHDDREAWGIVTVATQEQS